MQVIKSLVLLSILLVFESTQAQSIFRSVCRGEVDKVDSFLIAKSELISAKDKYGNAPLHFAVYCNQIESLEFLLSKNADIEATDNHGRTPLFYAAMRNNPTLLDLLIENKASIDIADAYGETPIHNASLNGFIEIVKILVESGASFEIKNRKANTPLSIAVREDHAQIVQLLTQHGADLNTVKNEFLSGPYIGQEAPGFKPVMFAPNFISTEHPQLDAVFHPNGNEFYYSIERSNEAKIMVTKQEHGQWMKPQTASFSGKYREVDLFITQDGSKLFYCSYRPLQAGDPPRDNPDLWMVQREAGDWSEPIHLGDLVNSKDEEWYPTISTGGTLFFSSGKEAMGESNICYSAMENGVYQAPVFLGDSVNSEFYDYDPFIAPDENYLIFASKRPGGFGDSDLYISYKTHKGIWSKAKNLGPTVNSNSADFTPILSPDGKYFFFTSWREGSGDIYWVKADAILNKR